MENKTTMELLNLLGKYSVKERNEEEISDDETDAYVEACNEIRQRAPFDIILNQDFQDNPPLEERIDDLEKNTEDFQKKIKRHKHDTQSGDVMIRI
jgi:hypothetical protein